ncbi:hypothetical protein BGZ83_010143 [Gryganskiella cystojenkinii]|nr:hypothetical protein BGZ83_010143 [Gryganskiella cystojenkinii]
MPLAGHSSEILPLHGQKYHSIQSHVRTFTRRITPARAVIALVSIFSFYILFYASSSQRSSSLKNPSRHNSGRLGQISSKDRKARVDRQRMLLEWDARSNYRTDLAESGSGRVSSFSPSLFSAGSRPPSSSKYIPVTAVILSWKRKEGAKDVVAHLRQYPFIKEILIWNNNPEVVLSAKDFSDRRTPLENTNNGDESEGQDLDRPLITVFNSVANLHDFSKYTTCTFAKYDHCYIQDDDWINLAMDSMYSLFVDQPNTLVTSTIPAMHAQQRTWMFHNPQIGLHTGFSWLGAGSFMPKQTVFRFLQQLGGSNLWKERVQLSDLFFSLWRNQYPIVLSHALAPLDQSSSWSGHIDQWSVVYEHMTDAMTRITTVLSGLGIVNGSPHRIGAKTDFMADEEAPFFKDRHTRSSCTNDKCLFQTNVDMFPAPDQVKWPSEPHNRDIHAHETRFRALQYPSAEFVAMHTYHYAVDEDLSTCWNSFKTLKKGSFFGLQFVLPLLDLGEHAQEIEIWSTLPTTLQALESHMVIKASVDGASWLTCKGQAERTQGSVKMTNLVCADAGRSVGIQLDTRGIQHLRFEMTDNTSVPIEICGIRIGDMLL